MKYKLALTLLSQPQVRIVASDGHPVLRARREHSIWRIELERQPQPRAIH